MFEGLVVVYHEKEVNRKLKINLQNPKTYTPLMLFFGCLFVFFGTVYENYTANNTLLQAGYALIIGSASLWVLREFKHKF